MIAVWFISYTKSDFTHGISLLKNNSGSGKTQRSITKHQSWMDCQNICNNLANKCTSFIWMKPSKGETGGHCHFMVKRDPSIQTCDDPKQATGAIWTNYAGYKKPIYRPNYICNKPHILARSIRNSALQIEERTISFADGTTFKEPALTQISDADCAIVCKYTDKCEVYNYIRFKRGKFFVEMCFLIEKPNKFERSRCPTGRDCITNHVFH